MAKHVSPGGKRNPWRPSGDRDAPCVNERQQLRIFFFFWSCQWKGLPRPEPSLSGAEFFLHAGTKQRYSPVSFLLYLFPFSSIIICSLILTPVFSSADARPGGVGALTAATAAAAGQARVLVFRRSGLCYVVIYIIVSSRFPRP